MNHIKIFRISWCHKCGLCSICKNRCLKSDVHRTGWSSWSPGIECTHAQLGAIGQPMDEKFQWFTQNFPILTVNFNIGRINGSELEGTEPLPQPMSNSQYWLWGIASTNHDQILQCHTHHYQRGCLNLTHWGRAMHICIIELGHHWFR